MRAAARDMLPGLTGVPLLCFALFVLPLCTSSPLLFFGELVPGIWAGRGCLANGAAGLCQPGIAGPKLLPQRPAGLTTPDGESCGRGPLGHPGILEL